MLKVMLLGPPQLMAGDRLLSVARRKSRAVVYYLAAHKTPLARARLLSIFWPDSDRPAAQQILRTTLHGLRKALGEALVVEDDFLSLAAGTDVDIRRFEASLQPFSSHLQPPTSDWQRLTAALSLYRGDFLEGFSLADAPKFEDWAAVERERFRRLAVRGRTALAKIHEDARDFNAALDALDRALAFDPLQEDLQREAIRLHYLAGDRAGAIRRYDHLRKLLDEEMGVPPMAETRAVYDAILSDSLPTSRPQSATAARRPLKAAAASAPHLISPSPYLPFVGRAHELRALRRASSAQKFALLEGEAGAGKTRLAEEFIREADALALTGGARELEQSLPYQPVIEALRSLLGRADWPALLATLQATVPAIWLHEVSRLLPECSPSPSAQEGAPRAADESRLWEGLHQFLMALSRQHPVIVFLDDLQWADSSTLALLGYLTRQPTPESVFFLATARPASPRAPLGILLQTLARESRLARVAVPRLGAEDITALAQQLSVSHADSLAEWLERNSEGNPYILVELARYAHANGLLTAEGEFHADRLSSSPVVPQGVYSLIQSRLARLSDSARRVLDAAVAVGREFDFEVAARASALSDSAALDALDELRLAALVYPVEGDPTGRLHAFDHSLTMEVAYREVGEARHRLLHRRVAEAMESLYSGERLEAAAGVIASHFAEGNAPERAAPFAFRAGQLAVRLAAWKEAVAFFEQALAGERDARRRIRIWMAQGDCYLRAVDSARAAEAFRAAMAAAQTIGEVQIMDEARLALGRSYLPQARYSEAITLARQVRESGLAEAAAHGELLWGAALSLEGADLAGAAEHLQNATALLGDRPASKLVLAQARFELGSVAAQRGDLVGAVALYREALAAAEQADPDLAAPQRILAHNNLAYHLHLLGEAAAIPHAREGLSLAQQNGVLGLQPYLYSTLGEIALAADDLAAAENYFTQGLALAERLSIPERIAGLTANLGRVAQRRGQTAAAIHRLSTALAQADSLGTRHLAAQIRLWIVPLLPPSEARARLAEARAVAESGGRQRLLDEALRLENSLG